MVEQPNIFDYATSELSQDAFLCYMLAFGKEELKKDFPDEYKIAHYFLKMCGIPEDEKILSVDRQIDHIDVLIVTTNYILIIEDKTYTNEHDDQIVRYVKNIRKKNPYEKKIRVCYFKTGDYVRPYTSPDDDALPQNNCCSLHRKDILDLLKNTHKCNLIFENFYRRQNNIEERITKCNDVDIKTWHKEKWFDFLSSVLSEHKFNIKWVNNASGGFYACYFDWENCGNGENYKQIEISFKNDITAKVKLCFKFSSSSKEITKDSGALIKELQNSAVKNGYEPSNRKGRSTTYAYKIASTKEDIKNFINDIF